MKWPTKGKRSKGKKKNEPSSPASNMGLPAAVTTNSNGVGLGTLRLGLVRSKSFSVSTPTPTSRRQLISELLGAESEGEADEPVTASPALRSMISRKSSTNDTLKDLNEEKVRGRRATRNTHAISMAKRDLLGLGCVRARESRHAPHLLNTPDALPTARGREGGGGGGSESLCGGGRRMSGW